MVLTRLVLGPEVTTASAMRAGCYRKRLEEGTAAVKRTESLSRATNPGPTQRGWHEAKRRRVWCYGEGKLERGGRGFYGNLNLLARACGE
jgi:hypothetical protein